MFAWKLGKKNSVHHLSGERATESGAASGASGASSKVPPRIHKVAGFLWRHSPSLLLSFVFCFWFFFLFSVCFLLLLLLFVFLLLVFFSGFPFCSCFCFSFCFSFVFFSGGSRWQTGHAASGHSADDQSKTRYGKLGTLPLPPQPADLRNQFQSNSKKPSKTQ